MTNEKEIIESRERFFIYFKCQDSELSPNEAIKALLMLQATVDDLQKNFLENTNIQIKVKPFKHGSFEIVLDLVINNSDYFKGIIDTCIFYPMIRGLFGLNKIEDLLFNIAKGGREAITQDVPLFIRTYIEVFLKTPNEKLEPLLKDLQINEKRNIDTSVKARSDFFKSLLSKEKIDAIGFNNREEDLIPKNCFRRYIHEDLVRELPDIYTYKELEITKPVLSVTSEARWGFCDVIARKNISAKIEDKRFVEAIKLGKYPLKTGIQLDRILCKVTYKRQIKNGKQENKVIIVSAVYRYNDKEIMPLPKEFELNKIYEAKI